MSTFLSTTAAQIRGLQQMAERALAQVGDDAFFRTLDRESNSLAIIVKHLGGNLNSRWTDFLTTDGEKPQRDRDGEFVIGSTDTRASLMAMWAEGWSRWVKSIESLTDADLAKTVVIRGVSMPAENAIMSGFGHAAQHVGQIVWLSKHLTSEQWKTLTVPRGQSKTWNLPASPAPAGPAR